MADDKKVITVNLSMFGQDAAAKTAAANKVAKELGISDEALAQVEDFKQQLTLHDAWDLPFMGYVNEDGYGYAYVPDAAICTVPYWDAHQAFLDLPYDVQTAFAIRMLFTHRPVDRYGADMFLHYQRGINVKWEGEGANEYCSQRRGLREQRDKRGLVSNAMAHRKPALTSSLPISTADTPIRRESHRTDSRTSRAPPCHAEASASRMG